MSKLLALVLVLLFAVVCSARVIVFTSVQTAPLTVTGTPSNDFGGIAYALATFPGGRNPARVRFFGLNTIGSSISAATLTLGGFEVAPLRIANRTNSAGLQFTAADLRLNNTVFQAMLTNSLVLNITTAAFPGGALVGTFTNAPGHSLAFLSSSGVVNRTVNSTAIGFAVTSLATSITEGNLPVDFFARNIAQRAASTIVVQAINNVTTPTSTSFNGPARSFSNGPVLASVGSVTSGAGNLNFANVSTQVGLNYAYVQNRLTYLAVDVSAGVSAIRGQFLPLTTGSRRQVPASINVAVGVPRVPVAGFGTLRRANNLNGVKETNRQSFVTISATDVGAGNFQTSTTFTFNPIVGRGRNIAQLRGIELDLSARTRGGNVTFALDWYRSVQGDFIQGATFGNLANFTQGGYFLFNPIVNQFPDIKGRITARLTSTAAFAHSVDLDLFSLRPYTADGISNVVLRLVSRQLEAAQYIAP